MVTSKIMRVLKAGALISTGLVVLSSFSSSTIIDSFAHKFGLHDHHNGQLCPGFFPKNNLRVPVGAKNVSPVTEESFNAILDRLETLYTPIFKDYKKGFEIERNWDDSTVNAYANQMGGTSFIHMFGGLARYKYMTNDGFALVACHEIGHHLGGVPRHKFLIFKMWASVEGQSDYFGTLKCLRKYFEEDDNITMMTEARVQGRISFTVDDLCKKVTLENGKTEEEYAICLRSSLASYDISNALNSLGGSSAKPISFDTPDKTVVRKTFTSHPHAQCRLDTYFAGALCDKAFEDKIDLGDEYEGMCNTKDGYSVGVRSLCWYKPKKS